VKEELDDDGNAVTKYLVKWESKPHNESTWELATDINVLATTWRPALLRSCSFQYLR
jgi:hypothetical protein